MFVKNGSVKSQKFFIISQVFQVVYFKVLGVMYYTVCGTYMVLGIVNNGEFRFYQSHGLISIDCVYHLGDAPAGYGFGINLVPIAIITLLYKIYKQKPVDKEINNEII